MFLTFNLTLAHLEVKLCEAAQIDLSTITKDDWDRYWVKISISRLIRDIRNNNNYSEEFKFTLETSLRALVYTFWVKKSEYAEFKNAVLRNDFNGILRSLNFDITDGKDIDIKANPNLLSSAINSLEAKINELKIHKMFLDINKIITDELTVFKQKNDKANIDLLEDLFDTFRSRYNYIETKELFFEKVKNKEWQNALNLAQDPNRWKNRLISRAFNILEDELHLRDINETLKTEELTTKMKKLHHILEEEGFDIKNWEELMWAILDKNWDTAMYYAGILD